MGEEVLYLIWPNQSSVVRKWDSEMSGNWGLGHLVVATQTSTCIDKVVFKMLKEAILLMIV